MGQVVTFAQLPASTISNGIDSASVAKGQEMVADVIRMGPGARWSGSAPRGSDCYLFMLEGAGTIAAGDGRRRFPAQAFATVQEGMEFTIENDGAPARIVRVIAPPQPSGKPVPGFTGKMAVAERASTPVLDLPEDKKKRIYFVGDHGARSKRGHAMIVVYEKDTVTRLHHHPNAESMFVIIDGALQFTVNGKQVVVKPGQAAFFGCNDQHGLHVADGAAGASFLEFHIPGGYTTVRA
jgi:mannose-6-phosphate isomerase-like protein (cupin superfamily)